MTHGTHPKFDPKIHHRKFIRLQGYDYSQAGAYFVTIVTYQRDCLFGDVVNGEMRLNDFGKIADECWLAIPEHFPNVELGAYVIMPNHAHGVIVIRDDESASTVVASPLRQPSRAPRDQNAVHWGQSLGRTNLPFHIKSTRNTTPQASGSGIITNISSATNGRWTTSGDTSKPIPSNGTKTMKTHQIIGGKIHSTNKPLSRGLSKKEAAHLRS
jgi:REP element-mobilizing transposase RayT